MKVKDETMKHTGKTAAVLAVVMSISMFAQVFANAADVDGKAITSAAAIVIDFETGAELYGHNPDMLRPPASMTKMMTVYIVYEAIANGEVGMDTKVPVSAAAYSTSRDPGLTNVPLSTTGTYTVDEMLDVVIGVSACGATQALAELLGGTSSVFIKRMNAKAAEMGIDAVFFSTFGGTTRTNMTPRAMAILTRNLIIDYPEVLAKSSKKYFEFKGRTYENTNLLLGEYEGVDGLKTGTAAESRECFTGTAARGDMRIITVTMGSAFGRRFSDTAILLDYGFAVLEARLEEERLENERLENERIEKLKVPPISSAVIFNGKTLGFDAYLIDGSNYFKIRDLAYALRWTTSQFDVGYDGKRKAILLISGKAYTPVGGELAGGSNERKLPLKSELSVLLDGEESAFTVYNIEGGSYFKLRDIAGAFDFSVEWDEPGNTILINAPLADNAEQQAGPPAKHIPYVPYVVQRIIYQENYGIYVCLFNCIKQILDKNFVPFPRQLR